MVKILVFLKIDVTSDRNLRSSDKNPRTRDTIMKRKSNSEEGLVGSLGTEPFSFSSQVTVIINAGIITDETLRKKE